ncbi:hypothetical protein BDZ91DRAFT_796544 [Kalaharituber pfeilii]|nr:hypothetical protein BDZ91DRAFT_796544 [Kalaharituber pfeilii]
MSDILQAVGEVIKHVDECIDSEDQMTRPNFEPTDRSLVQIRFMHLFTSLLATRVKGLTCKGIYKVRGAPEAKEGETQTDLETPVEKAKKVHHFPIQKYESGAEYQSLKQIRSKLAKDKPSSTPLPKPISKERKLPQSSCAVAVHGITVMKKLGKLVKKERREGKKSSSIIVYLQGKVESDSQIPVKIESLPNRPLATTSTKSPTPTPTPTPPTPTPTTRLPTPTPDSTPRQRPKTSKPSAPSPNTDATTSTFGVVVHGIALRKDLGKVRKWLESGNKGLGKTVGIRWLRRKTALIEEGKKTSSVLVYLEAATDIDRVRLGGKLLRTTQYEPDRRRK